MNLLFMQKTTKLISKWLLPLCLGLIGTSLHADDFAAGIKAYQDGHYAEASTAFERSLAEGEDAAARHNLALSQYQQGHPAEAVWQLERALRLEPLNQKYTLKLAALRQQLGLQKPVTTWWLRAAEVLTERTWTWIACAGFWVLATAILLPRIAGWRRPLLLKLVMSLAAAGLLLGSAALTIRATQQPAGIILSSDAVPLHHAPASAAPEAGLARAGERIRILDQHHQFLKVETEANISGWLHAESLRKL